VSVQRVAEAEVGLKKSVECGLVLLPQRLPLILLDELEFEADEDLGVALKANSNVLQP
jgi:hypothetical protein